MGGRLNVQRDDIAGTAEDSSVATCFNVTPPSGGDIWKLWVLAPHLLPSGSLRSCRSVVTGQGVALALVEAHVFQGSVISSEVPIGGSPTPDRHELTASRSQTALEYQLHIRRIREVLSMTVAQIAETVQVSRQAVHSWQRGESVPSDENSRRIEWLNTIANGWTQRSNDPLGRWLKVDLWGDGRSILRALQDHEETSSIFSMLEDVSTRAAEVLAQLRDEVAGRSPSDIVVERQRARLQLQRNRYFRQ